MQKAITYEELLAEVDKLSTRKTGDDGWLRSEEWASEWGTSVKKALDLIKKMNVAGYIEASRKNMTAVDGRITTAACYRFKAAEKATKAKTKSR